MTEKHQIQFPSFRTVVEFPENQQKISHDCNIINIGSCFSEHIGQYLNDYKFKLCINPTGILYNPSSICQVLKRLISGKKYSKEDLFSHEGIWKSFYHHSDFNAGTSENCLQKINGKFETACELLKKINILILTFGTSFVYYKKDTGQIVANCHQLPHVNFKRSLLPITTIVSEYSELLDSIYKLYPEINIIMTVSPVRHLRDNPHENQVSKAHLIAAVQELEDLFSRLYYFPSYEIMMDELRDYRFYGEDMVHPSGMAIDYIWKRFIASCIDRQSALFISKYESIFRAKSHDIKDYTSKATRIFAETQLDKINALQTEFNTISLSEDTAYFNTLLKKLAPS
jgi:hypothetical protein